MTGEPKKKIAIWHRYGPEGHTACGGHAMPLVVRELAKHAEVHYFGMHSGSDVPPLIREHAILHYLPVHFNRSSARDKVLKTLFWYLATPFMAIKCKRLGVKLIFNDETLPLMALLLRTFFGKNVVITVADFFLTIYGQNRLLLRPVCRWVQAVDYATWRKLPLIITKVDYTHTHLTQHGVDTTRLKTSYNPCDQNVYFPRDKQAARRRLGISPDALVLVHHGILHPNKGNDWIIRALAELRNEYPSLLYLLAGDGPEKKHIERLILELDMQKHVRMTGWLPSEEDVNFVLNAGDIGLVMRIGQFSDNFHLTDTLAHEMACALPILAANLAGITEFVIDGENGYRFKPDDKQQFKTCFKKLADSPASRLRLGTNSLAIVKERLNLHIIAGTLAEALIHQIKQ